MGKRKTVGHLGSDDFTVAGKWQGRRQGGVLPVDEALEDVHCYIKIK